MNFQDEFNNYIVNFDAYLTNYMQSLSNADAMLNDSVNYSLFSGGKRIRPVLMIAFCDLLGGDKSDVYPFACALEMIHTYSLIHDDLPCMDNDTMRRGKPTNHVKYGENMALLAGDALLTQAFELVSSLKLSDSMIKNQLRSINILANCAGMSGMVSGQCCDLNMGDVSKEKIVELYRLKTSRLFCAACTVGAIMSGANETEVNLAGDYGEKLGIAYQLVDDILDKEENLLSAFKGETPQEFLIKLTNEAKESLRGIRSGSEFLLELTDYLANRTH